MAATLAANLAANLPAVQSLPAPEDYEAIEAAVMETARGRWFLAEYARRMRAAETAKLLEAVTRIERTLRTSEQDSHPQHAGALSAPQMGQAVAAVQERLSEIAWSLRERGFDERACTQIEAQARALGHLAEAHGFDPADEALRDEPPMQVHDYDDEDAPDDATAASIDVAPSVVMPMQIESRFASLAAIDALEDRARARLFY
jgi:hypothetical protein